MNLPTRDQFIKNRAIESGILERYSEPRYHCPNCKEGGMREDQYSCLILASYPPQHQSTYKCDSCGYEETLTTF